MNKLKFSVVIANYNHGSFLETAIKSVLDQNYIDCELLIVDGGSTDMSLEIIRKYEQYIYWWVSEPDKGQSDAFNKGFSKATGDFFLWLNADDVLLPKALENASKYLIKHTDCMWLTGGTVYFNKLGIIQRCCSEPLWSDLLMKKYWAGNLVNGPSSIFKSELFRNTGGMDETLHYVMDMDLWLKMTDLNVKFHRLKFYIWGFRIHENSKTSHSIGKKAIERFESEGNFVLARAGRRRSKLAVYYLWFFKMFTGVYINTYYDTWRWNGKSIKERLSYFD